MFNAYWKDSSGSQWSYLSSTDSVSYSLKASFGSSVVQKCVSFEINTGVHYPEFPSRPRHSLFQLLEMWAAVSEHRRRLNPSWRGDCVGLKQAACTQLFNERSLQENRGLTAQQPWVKQSWKVIHVPGTTGVSWLTAAEQLDIFPGLNVPNFSRQILLQ